MKWHLKWQRIGFLLLSMIILLWNVTFLPQGIPTVKQTALPAKSEGNDKYIALTFDDGPRADTTLRLLNGLRKRGANATFFLVGSQIADNVDVVRRMKADGNQVGNHSWSHRKLQGKSDAVVKEEIGRTDAMLQKVLGKGTYWVRPPYGLLNEQQKKLFSVPLVHWSIDPKDWKLRNADADVAAVMRNVKPGDIILMHDAVPASVNAAFRIVDALEKRGYQFVTVKELLVLNGVKPCNGVMYHSSTNAE